MAFGWVFLVSMLTAIVIICLVTFPLQIAMIAIGTKYKDECPVEDMIPIYLIVAGSAGLFSSCCSCGLRYTRSDGEEEQKIYHVERHRHHACRTNMADDHDSGQLPCGYDEDFVSPVDEDLQCSICYLALREPVLTRCGHRFCRECLDRHMARQKNQNQVCNCPVDRQGLVHRQDIFPDKATGRKILSLIIKCPSTGCEWTGELRKKKDHVDYCKKKPVECPNSCGAFIVRKEITSHIDNDCPLTVISCPYAQMGCDTKIQRKEIECHLQSTTRLHLAFTCTTFKETTEKLEQLQKQVEGLKAANSALNAKVDTQKKELTAANYALSTKVDVHKMELVAVDAALNEKMEAQKRDTTSVNSSLSAKMEAQKRELTAANSALSLKVDAQAKEISRLTNESSPFVWKITGFSDILRQAKNGNTKSIYNEFYTGKQGYKLKVRINPDGDQSNKNRYLSAFVGIMKGNYDPILAWPFRQQVTFTVIDQQYDPAKRQNVVGVVNTEQTPWRFAGRPTTEQNGELYGIPRLVSHKVLNTRRYTDFDTLFLQVEVGPHDHSECQYSDSDSDPW